MRKYIFLLLFSLLPFTCFADFICSSPQRDFSFKIQNINSFSDYDFYFSAFGDTTIRATSEIFKYSCNHPLCYGVLAKDKKNGELTSVTPIVNVADSTVLVIIDKIENDSIYCHTKNIMNQNSSEFSGAGFWGKLLIFISLCAVLIYYFSVRTRKKYS